MYIPAIQIALDKAESQRVRESLANILRHAEELGRIEADFEARLNALKAARGEKPVKLTRARADDVSGFAQDAKEMEAQQLILFENEMTSAQIIRSLKGALSSDLKFWQGAGRYTHPADMPAVEEFVSAKQRLKEALSKHLRDAG